MCWAHTVQSQTAHYISSPSHPKAQSISHGDGFEFQCFPITELFPGSPSSGDPTLISVTFFTTELPSHPPTRRNSEEMGPPKTLRTISQEAFDEVVRENVEDLGMDPAEALQDAIETLTLQGVDLSGDLWNPPGNGLSL